MAEIGDNSKVVQGLTADERKECLSIFQELKKLDEETTSINADKNALRKSLVAKGIPADAVQFAYKRWKKDPEDRDAMDFGIAQLTKAALQPMQLEMEVFDPDAGKQPEKPKK